MGFTATRTPYTQYICTSYDIVLPQIGCTAAFTRVLDTCLPAHSPVLYFVHCTSVLAPSSDSKGVFFPCRSAGRAERHGMHACAHPWIARGILTYTIYLQVGMHGAGLSNSYFMRRRSSFVEILPCRFGFDWQDSYYRDPHRIENCVFGFKLRIQTPELCSRPSLEKNLEGRPSCDCLALFCQS